jgi:hypothetical protein
VLTPTRKPRRYANRWQSFVLPENPRPLPALVFSGSNRVSSLQTSGLRDHHQPHQHRFPCTLRCPTRDAGRCRH